MTARQISVFIENKPGMMVKITDALGNAGVDMRAMSLADTQDFGILRLIVDDTDKAIEALKAVGCVTSVTDVIVAELPDVPGAMTSTVRILAENGINIEYIYAFVSPEKNKKAYIVFRIKDTEKACSVLTKEGIILAGEGAI